MIRSVFSSGHLSLFYSLGTSTKTPLLESPLYQAQSSPRHKAELQPRCRAGEHSPALRLATERLVKECSLRVLTRIPDGPNLFSRRKGDFRSLKHCCKSHPQGDNHMTPFSCLFLNHCLICLPPFFPFKQLALWLSVHSHMISSDKEKCLKSQVGIRKQ